MLPLPTAGVALMFLAACACAEEHRELATPRAEELAPALETGAPLLRLTGGGLRAPLDVPLWLGFDDRDRADDKCELFHEWFILPLPGQRLYVHESNPRCGRGHGCRILDLETGRLARPAAGCLEAFGCHIRAWSLGGDWVLVDGDCEGVGELSIVRYSPEAGQETLRRFSFGSADAVTWEIRGEALVLQGPCGVFELCGQGEPAGSAIGVRWAPATGLARE